GKKNEDTLPELKVRGSCSRSWKKKNMPVLPFLLLSAVVLMCSGKLQEVHRIGVELALQNAGFDVVYIYHNFYLKATTCKRGTENADTSTCAFRNDRPLIDCAICYKTFAGKIESEPIPYINCVHKPALTEEIKKERIDHCNKMGYSSGSPTLLAVVSK
ncbi:hypothetical protein DNTS_005121, partial [Danionella cerebrum]